MTQRRYTNWKDLRLSDPNNRKDLGISPFGLWRGFDYDASSSGTDLVLSHDSTTGTGYTETDETGVALADLGVVKTLQGVHVIEDADVHIALTDNSGGADPRIDLVCLQHAYIETPGGVDAGYTVIVGTPSATPVAPAIPFPETTIVLGQILWPAGGTDISLATYTRSVPPVVGGGEAGGQDYVLKSVEQTITASKTIQHQKGLLNEIVMSGTDLTADVNSNWYLLDNTDSDYHTIMTLTIPNEDQVNFFSVRCDQRIALKVDPGGNITIAGCAFLHIEEGEFFDACRIGSKWRISKGGELRRDSIDKKFAGIIGNKGEATAPAANKILLDNKGNYFELAVGFSTLTNIDLISGNDALWDGINANTKGGNIIIVRFTDTDPTSLATVTLAIGGTPAGVYKPITFADHIAVLTEIDIVDGGYAIFVENETSWGLVGTFDNRTTPFVIREALDALSASVTALTSLGSWFTIPAGTDWSNAAIPTPQYSKDGLRTVYLRGVMSSASTTPAAILGTLPVGYRPSTDINKALSMYNDTAGTWSTVNIFITTGGDIAFQDTTQIPTAIDWAVWLDLSFITSP